MVGVARPHHHHNSPLAAEGAAKTQARFGARTLGKLAVFFAFGGWRLGFGCDGYLDVSTFFQLHFIAVPVR
jgi:hypothetical protein